MRVVFEDEHLKLEYNQESKFIVQTWKGFTPDPIFTKLLDKVTLLSEAKGIKGMIIDMRQHRGLSPTMQFHFTNSMQKIIEAQSTFKQAIMEPMDPFAIMTVNTYLHELGKRKSAVVSQYFDAFEEAKKWLEGMSVSA